MESSLGVALTTLCTVDCDRRLAFSACVTTVYLECRELKIMCEKGMMLLLPPPSLSLSAENASTEG